MKNKTQAREDYIEMVKKSWTYNRMTSEEKKKCLQILNDEIKVEVYGTSYKQRWNTLNGVYWAYLVGLGYPSYDDPYEDWRKKPEE